MLLSRLRKQSLKLFFVLSLCCLLLSSIGMSVAFASPTPTHSSVATEGIHQHTGVSPLTGIADLIGVWTFNSNGTTGHMRIYNATSDGYVTLSVSFDGLTRIDYIFALWDDVAKSITMIRYMPNGIIQTYVGYLGDNTPGAPILAGTFTESDITDTTSRTTFGWFAQYSYSVALAS